MPSIPRECHPQPLGLTESALHHAVKQENTHACRSCNEYNVHLLTAVEMTNSPRGRVQNDLPSIVCCGQDWEAASLGVEGVEGELAGTQDDFWSSKVKGAGVPAATWVAL